jgi:hypothetical protein
MNENEYQSLACFRCGSLDHFVANCDLLKPAANYEEHAGRIKFYVDRWVERKMTRQQKRQAISLENEMWYSDDVPSNLVIR